MFEPKDVAKYKGKCPYCGKEVLEFTGCYVCQKCYRVWSIGLNEWEKDNPNKCCCKEPLLIVNEYSPGVFCKLCGKIYNGHMG